eukprot:752906-Hanusia_phi.AAC.9
MADPETAEAALAAAAEERSMAQALGPLNPACREAIMAKLMCEQGEEKTAVQSMQRLRRVSWLAALQTEPPWPRRAAMLLLDAGQASSCAMLFRAAADVSVLEPHRSCVLPQSLSWALAHCLLACEEFWHNQESRGREEQAEGGKRQEAARRGQGDHGRMRMRAGEGRTMMRLVVGALVRHVSLSEEDERNERVFSILRDAVRMFRRDLNSRSLRDKDVLFPEPVQKLLALFRVRRVCDVRNEFVMKDVEVCRSLLRNYMYPLQEGEKSLASLFDAGWDSLDELMGLCKRYFSDDIKMCKLFQSYSEKDDLGLSDLDGPNMLIKRILGVHIRLIKTSFYHVKLSWHEACLPQDLFVVLHRNYNPRHLQSSTVSTRQFEACKSVCDGHFQVFFAKDLSFSALANRALSILCLFSFLRGQGGGGGGGGEQVDERREGREEEVQLDKTTFMSLVEWIAEEASHNIKQQFCL